MHVRRQVVLGFADSFYGEVLTPKSEIYLQIHRYTLRCVMSVITEEDGRQVRFFSVLRGSVSAI